MKIIIFILSLCFLNSSFSNGLLSKRQQCIAYLHDRNEIVYFIGLIKNGICNIYDLEKKEKYANDIKYINCQNHMINKLNTFKHCSYNQTYSQECNRGYFDSKNDFNDCEKMARLQFFTQQELDKIELSNEDKISLDITFAANGMDYVFEMIPYDENHTNNQKKENGLERSVMFGSILKLSKQKITDRQDFLKQKIDKIKNSK